MDVDAGVTSEAGNYGANLSHTKLRAARESRPFLSARRRRDSIAAFAPWRTRPPRDGESLRWESLDGRWVAIAQGHGASAGSMLVADSAGRCESVESYDGAVALAKSWCT
jgi:hypothetical protein